jgi:DNA-directed RNA polymerase subunit RPC12/RpoP
MVCSRCGKESNTDRPERNAEMYGVTNVFACPYCGKAYWVTRIDIVPASLYPYKEDDWGNVVISDEEYEKVKRLKK